MIVKETYDFKVTPFLFIKDLILLDAIKFLPVKLIRFKFRTFYPQLDVIINLLTVDRFLFRYDMCL